MWNHAGINHCTTNLPSFRVVFFLAVISAVIFHNGNIYVKATAIATTEDEVKISNNIRRLAGGGKRNDTNDLSNPSEMTEEKTNHLGFSRFIEKEQDGDTDIVDGPEQQQLQLHQRLHPSLPRLRSPCDMIHPEDLPSECYCREPGHYSVVIECLKTFDSEFFNDTIGIQLDIDPCNDAGSKMSLDITEQQHGIDYQIAGIKAGESQNIPIPGASIIVPGIGHLGLDVSVLIAGNPDKLILMVGLNACIGVASHTICASSIPGLNKILPWYILQGTYHFGAFCNSTSTTMTDDAISGSRADRTAPATTMKLGMVAKE